MLAADFPFYDVPQLFRLADQDLELVEPDARHVADLLAACHHPLTRDLMPAMARTDRDSISTFLKQNPHGHTVADSGKHVAPGYTFWMRVRPDVAPRFAAAAAAPMEVAIAGSISLRIGHSDNLDRYLGHVGYHVLPPARGRHFAERAVRMLLPLARAHQQGTLWITCNPDNLASRRTCEHLGATYVDVVPVPKDNPLYSQGDRQKCRYRLDL